LWRAPPACRASLSMLRYNLPMSRTLLIRISAGILFLLISWIGYTQNQGGQPPPLTINKVKEDLYEIEGDGGNVAVYITNEGVILIDDK
jgi:hypothetical protein